MSAVTDDSSLISQHPSWVERELRHLPDGQKAILIRRWLEASTDEVWAALTDPSQIIRWYLPLDGDLRAGGYYALIGNAVGEIHRCQRPREISVSWVYGEFESELAVRLAPASGGTLLELAHRPIPVEMITNPTPELWGLAVNWEMVLVSLDDFLAGRSPEGMAADWMPRMSEAARAETMARGCAFNDAWLELIGLPA